MEAVANVTGLYTTCLYCHARFGTNEIIEWLPVGTRLAFDPAKGRLWVICRACGGWNLTALDERWESLEACERLFRSSSLRQSTDNIGLARIGDRFELVRIGKPLRPELMIWRYGGTLRQNRGRAYLRLVQTVPLAAAGAAIPLGLFIAGAWYQASVPIVSAILVGSTFSDISAGIWKRAMRNRVVLSTTISDRPATIRAIHCRDLKFVCRDNGWQLQLVGDEGKAEIPVDESVSILARVLPVVNGFERSAPLVRKAAESIEDAGSPLEYLESVAEARQSSDDRTYIAELPVALRVGLEIAAQEEFERRVLDRELHLLESAWREAEELAQIADNLLVPPWIDERIAAERRR